MAKILIEDADLATLWLLGNPVSHSLSPLIQNRALSQLQLKIVYLAAAVKDEDFEAVVTSLPKLGAIGANVTVPYKERAFRMCDSLSTRAQAMGAVNTLHFRETGLYGDNTDGVGWWRALQRESQDFDKAVVIGAGGAARAICHTLLQKGFHHLVLLNRTLAKAESLLGELKGLAAPEVKLEVSSLESCAVHLQERTLLIQTTSVGLKEECSPVPLPTVWPEGALLSELVYGHQTALLRAVRDLGGAHQDGLGMLCGQAAESLALWLNKSVEEIPLSLMQEVAWQRVLSTQFDGDV